MEPIYFILTPLVASQRFLHYPFFLFGILQASQELFPFLVQNTSTSGFILLLNHVLHLELVIQPNALLVIASSSFKRGGWLPVSYSYTHSYPQWKQTPPNPNVEGGGLSLLSFSKQQSWILYPGVSKPQHPCTHN